MLREVRVENGLVRGLPAADPRITAFKGIPFAAQNLRALEQAVLESAGAGERLGRCAGSLSVRTDFDAGNARNRSQRILFQGMARGSRNSDERGLSLSECLDTGKIRR